MKYEDDEMYAIEYGANLWDGVGFSKKKAVLWNSDEEAEKEMNRIAKEFNIGTIDNQKKDEPYLEVVYFTDFGE